MTPLEMKPLSRPLADLKSRYDVIVVGSGYGGGVTAARLSRAGLSVCVLERGREVLTGEFPARFTDARREFRVTGGRIDTGPETALFDMRLGADMHVLVGCGLGGGSLVNAGVALEPDARVFADPVWPDEIRADGMLADGYARARRWLKPARDPQAENLNRFRALDKASAAVESRPVKPTISVTFEQTINEAGITQPACTRCGDCCGGCNVGAKTTVALTYLPVAAQAGAEIFTRAKVAHVERLAGGGWRVAVKSLETGDAAERIVEGSTVVVSAGTLGSTEILLRSAARGLAISPRIGERFSANGDIIAFGYGANMPIDGIGVGEPAKADVGPIGAAVSCQIELKSENLEHEMTVQEGAMPSAFAAALPLMFVPGGRFAGALQSLVSGVYKGPLSRLQTYFAVSHDSAAGRLHLDGDRLRLAWPGAHNEPVYARLDDVLGKLSKEIGATYIKNPLAGSLMGSQPATAHPLGGCAMGRDRTTGVVDHAGRVFDARASDANASHRGLYVVDGSIIPRSLGVNPLLTITALAERSVIHIARDLRVQLEDQASPVR